MMQWRGHPVFDDDAAAVEEIPFRLLIMIMLTSASLAAAASGMDALSEVRVRSAVDSQMADLAEMAIAVSSSGGGSRVYFTLEIPATPLLKVDSLSIGGPLTESSASSTTYRLELSNGITHVGLVVPGFHQVKITNPSGDGAFELPITGGRVGVVLTSIECQGESVVVMMEESFDADFDVGAFEDENNC